ncbi:MAG TPA: hypothetical protein VFM88_03665 [Vicinamibacteria bacterium]|nr:hypothetical protein [Vicinamibacteria bacterium]
MRAAGRVTAVALAAALLGGAGPSGADIAVVVHPSNPRSEVSSDELLRILRMDRQHWEAGHRIYLVIEESGTPERAVLLRRVYRMNDAELKQFWLGKLYRGEIAAFPRLAPSGAAAKRLVSQAPNAIGFIEAGLLDGSVKALRIDAKRPGEDGYMLSPD